MYIVSTLFLFKVWLILIQELFEQLPQRIQGAQSSVSHKKRPAASQTLKTASMTLRNGPDFTTKTMSAGGTNNVSAERDPSPTQNGTHAPLASPNQTTFRPHIVPHIDTTYRRGSQDPYSPLTSNHARKETSDSPHSSMPPNGDQSAYDMQNTFIDQGVRDVSAVMFPSGDPFAYPNQPMTTLENRQFIKQENPIGSTDSMYNVPGTTTAGAPYDNYAAQVYGQMPPYLIQDHQSGYLQGMNEPLSMSDTDPNANPTTQGFEPGHWPLNRQERSSNTSGVGFDQLFGEDWGGWMSQYRQ